ncbi:MAG: hypothetical protein QOJ98_680 [Acidobacteriota bacterium]|nr:hypothetical protein [Acidobacteriota bacterium]
MQQDETIQFDLSVETISILGGTPPSDMPTTTTTENCTSLCSPPTCCR